MSSRTPWNAAAYDDLHAYVARGGEPLIDLLAPRAGERILDLGCGTAHLTRQIADRGAAVVGIDASSEMVERARAGYPELDIRLADATTFDLDEPFDGVFSNAVLHWIPRAAQPAVAARVARALRSGGRFVAEMGGKGNVQQILGAAQASLAEMGYEAVPPFWYFPALGEYASLLEAAGLSVIRAELFDRPTPLEDDERGLRHWLEMFARDLLAPVPLERRTELVNDIERRLRPRLYRDGGWTADYRRLRLVAIKDLEQTGES